MKDPAAHDLARPFNAALAQKPPAPPTNPVQLVHDKLSTMLNGTATENGQSPPDKWQGLRPILRQLLPGPTYPKYLRDSDTTTFENYWHFIDDLGLPPQDKDQISSPTQLSISQRAYDAEATRRDSINTRCSTVLSTAGILGTLVVAAGQIGLTLHKQSLSGSTWPVLIFFLISLAYLGYSIVIALQVHGAIQGDLVDARDLWSYNPAQTSINGYNLNIAKTMLLYANYNWCLNNDFKYRLQSAQRALRNGVIAVIIAGAVSPWAVSPSTSPTGAPTQPTPPASSHATANTP